MTDKEQEQKFRDTCIQLIKRDGACNDIACVHCPGASHHNEGMSCSRNGWSDPSEHEVSPHIVASAQQWMRDHPGVIGGKMILEAKLREYVVRLVESMEHMTGHQAEMGKAMLDKNYALAWDHFSHSGIHIDDIVDTLEDLDDEMGLSKEEV